MYELVFADPDVEQQALLLCNGEQMCLFDIAVTGKMDVGLSTLIANQEVTLVTQLSLPGQWCILTVWCGTSTLKEHSNVIRACSVKHF